VSAAKATESPDVHAVHDRAVVVGVRRPHFPVRHHGLEDHVLTVPGRAARLAGATVLTGRTGAGRAPLPECLDCRRPFPAAVPEDGLCGTCREEAAAGATDGPAEMQATLAGSAPKTPLKPIPRVREFPDSGPTCENTAKPQVAPDSGVFRDPGNPRVINLGLSRSGRLTCDQKKGKHL
jgi:hypothetical protein